MKTNEGLNEGKINRRSFFKGAISLALCTAIVDPISARAEKIVGKKSPFEQINYDLSGIDLNHECFSRIKNNEISFFLNYFGLTGSKMETIVEKIKEIQKEGKLGNDGVLGRDTLKYIYLTYYAKEEKIPNEIKERLEIYNEMSEYKKFRKKAQTNKFNVFREETFYGVSENVIGSYYETNLLIYIDNNNIPFTSTEANAIKFFNINGKTVLAMYIDSKLHLLVHASAGKLNTKTPSRKTSGEVKPDMYHVSSSYPKTTNGGAIMPYAVHAFGSVYIHGSDGTIDGRPQSHGCIRVGLFYIKEIYRQVSRLGIDNVVIDTKGIYQKSSF